MKRTKVLEQLTGTGRLKGPQDEIDVSYGVTVYMEVLVLPDGAELDGLRSIQARVITNDSDVSWLWTANGRGDHLTLQLEDGRQVPCFITNVGVGSATLVARGAFE